MRNRGLLAGLVPAVSALALAGAANGNEVIAYGYDSLGRLTRVERSGTVNGGVSATYRYDSADNRTNVTVAGAGAPPPPSPPPPPPPPPPGPNRPPVAVDDHGEGRRCQSRDFNVVANDGDPDGDPMTVTAVGGGPDFTILSATTIRYANGGQVGLFSATYTIGDGRGGSATAILHVDVPRDHCL